MWHFWDFTILYTKNDISWWLHKKWAICLYYPIFYSVKIWICYDVYWLWMGKRLIVTSSHYNIPFVDDIPIFPSFPSYQPLFFMFFFSTSCSFMNFHHGNSPSFGSCTAIWARSTAPPCPWHRCRGGSRREQWPPPGRTWRFQWEKIGKNMEVLMGNSWNLGEHVKYHLDISGYLKSVLWHITIFW